MCKLSYHWTNEEGTLRYGDGRKVVVGETLHVSRDRDVQCGEWGLFASPTVRQSLRYCPGPRLWGVELGNVEEDSGDKQGSYSRFAARDFGNQLGNVVLFAKWCAADADADAARAAARAASYAAAYAERQNQDLWWDTTLGLVIWEGC